MPPIVIWEILLAEVTFKTRMFGIYLSKHMSNSDFNTYAHHCQLPQFSGHGDHLHFLA